MRVIRPGATGEAGDATRNNIVFTSSPIWCNIVLTLEVS